MVEKDLKHSNFERDKLKNKNKQLTANTKQAYQLYKQTLKVKIKYEDLIQVLHENEQI